MLSWQLMNWKQRAIAISGLLLVLLLAMLDPGTNGVWRLSPTTLLRPPGMIILLLMISLLLDPRTFHIISRDQPMPRISLWLNGAAIGAGLGELLQYAHDQQEFRTMAEICNKVIGTH
jgi:hypothetical protein